jgi:putative endonuclease
VTWLVYVLRCADDTLYTGVTTDLARRLAEHLQGCGARYTRGRGPFTVHYQEPAPSRGAALAREAAIKRLTRQRKLALATAGA